MSNIIPFNYHEREIRIIQDENGTPWWVAKDVCSLLGFADHNSAVRSHLDEDEKGVRQAHTLGGKQDLLTVNESGLYALIFKSGKPEARPFRKWVTSEVLPLIRKTGYYSIPKKTKSEQPPETVQAIAKDFRALKTIATIAGLKGNQAVLMANKAMVKLKGANPLELIGATHLICDKQNIHLTATELGKSYGLSAQKTNQLLESNGVIESFRDSKNKLKWKATKKGEPFTVLKDTGKKDSDGTPVQQLFYLDSVKTAINDQG